MIPLIYLLSNKVKIKSRENLFITLNLIINYARIEKKMLNIVYAMLSKLKIDKIIHRDNNNVFDRNN